MGMESRRYTFGPRFGGGGAGGWITPAIKELFFLNVGVFLLQTLITIVYPGSALWIFRNFGLVPSDVVFSGKIWQPFTYLFLHGGLWHLLLNMLVLWMFGCDIERAWGRIRFYRYYLITGVGAALCIVLIKFAASIGGISRSDIPTVGASGAIFGVLIAAAILFPDRQVWLFPFPVTLPMRAFAFIMGLIAFFGSLGSSGDGISHVAHLGGMLVGYIYLRRGTHFFRLRNTYSDWQRRRLQRRFEVYKRRHQQEPPSRPDDWLN